MFLIVTRNGYGKRTPIEEYRLQSSVVVKVLRTCNITDKNGKLVAVKSVTGEERYHVNYSRRCYYSYAG